MYAGSDEILEYFRSFALKYNLRKNIKFGQQIVRAVWSEATGRYDVKIQHVETGETIDDYCNILVNAGGILNAWRWPAIPGLEKYAGKLLHTANWDKSVSLANKVVGLIGNG